MTEYNEAPGLLGLYDSTFRRIYTDIGPKMLVPWYLLSSYAYEVLNRPIISDGCFDWLCKELDVKWKEASKHAHAKYVDRSAVKAGSGLAARWPTLSREAAKHLALSIYGAMKTTATRKDRSASLSSDRGNSRGIDRSKTKGATSMDEVLERIANALERIADTLAERGGGESGGGEETTTTKGGGKGAAAGKKAAAGKGKAKGPTLDDVRNALREYAKLEGKDAAKAMLQEHGEVDAVSELEEDKFQAVIDACS